MKYTRRILCLLVLVLAMATGAIPALTQSASYISGRSSAATYPAVASDASDDPQGSVLTIRERVDEVNVLFIATDKHGKFVRDLNQTDFSILDDHKPPQAIVNFRRETDLPLDMGLLIDSSGSVHGRFDFEQSAATSFLEHTIRRGFDRAFVVGFNTKSQMTQDFTDNVTLLSAGVHNLKDGHSFLSR